MAFRHGLPPAEQFQAIGMVAVEYQRLEAFVNTGIWGLSKIYEKYVASAMTASLNLPTRLNILRELFQIRRHDKEKTKSQRIFAKKYNVLLADGLRLCMLSGFAVIEIRQ